MKVLTFLVKNFLVLILFILPSISIASKDVAVLVQLKHTGVVESVAFSPDGRYALSGSWDGTVRLWDISSGKEISQGENIIKAVAFISASTGLQEAIEGYQGHGLFTYVLTEGMKGRADTDRDGFIKTLELAAYVDSEVPALAERVFKKAQYTTVQPTGQSFPVGKVR